MTGGYLADGEVSGIEAWTYTAYTTWRIIWWAKHEDGGTTGITPVAMPAQRSSGMTTRLTEGFSSDGKHTSMFASL